MIELIQKSKERNQKVLIITVCMMICFSPLTHFVNQLCRTIIGTGFTLDTLLCYAILAGMILASLKQLHFQIKIDALLVLILFAVAFGLTYAFAGSNRIYMFTEWNDFAGNPLYLLFVFSLPGYVFMRYITDYDRLFEICRRFSVVVVFCSLGSFVLMLLRDKQPEYMSFSYNLLFATVFSTISFFEKKKNLSLVAAIIGILLIFLAGARGPLLCYLFSLFVYLLMSKAAIAKKLVLVFLLFSAGVIILLLWNQMLLTLKDTVEQIGISSRTIDILLEGEIFSDSSRGEIQKTIIVGFTLLGRGLYGDRVVGDGHYSHNLIIELISQWGYLLGTLIVVLLGVLFFKGFRTKNQTLRLLILAFFSSSVVKLMLSESYLAHNVLLFVLIAACVNALEEEKLQRAGEEQEPAIKKKSKYIKYRD